MTSAWATSSGGASGICVPNQLDNVAFDGQSFTLPNQTVAQDAVLATCRSLSWAAATNAPTFSGAAANRLAIYGSLTWSPAMSQQWLCETLLLGGGTLTSTGQTFGGALTINAPNETISLADALRQPRTGGSGLTLTAGSLLTNDQPVQVRSLTSAPLDGITTPPARSRWGPRRSRLRPARGRSPSRPRSRLMPVPRLFCSAPAMLSMVMALRTTWCKPAQMLLIR